MLKQNEEAKDLFEKFKFFYSNGQYKESIDILLKLAKLDNKKRQRARNNDNDNTKQSDW